MMTQGQIKSIVLICLIIGSIFFVGMIPVDITTGKAIKEVHSITEAPLPPIKN